MADSLREKKGVTWATAKLEDDDGDGTYVEYFRGKDFARFFRAAPEKMDDLVQPTRPGKLSSRLLPSGLRPQLWK